MGSTTLAPARPQPPIARLREAPRAVGTRITGWVLAGLVGAGIALRCWDLGGRPLNLDEQRKLYLRKGEVWKVSDDPKDERYLKLVPSRQNVFTEDAQLFALPDLSNDEEGAYAGQEPGREERASVERAERGREAGDGERDAEK